MARNSWGSEWLSKKLRSVGHVLGLRVQVAVPIHQELGRAEALDRAQDLGLLLAVGEVLSGRTKSLSRRRRYSAKSPTNTRTVHDKRK
tara:strand:+ start:1201 stop:1464 length:264 start_codon:yes stop_codon:yes gene_type:complete